MASNELISFDLNKFQLGVKRPAPDLSIMQKHSMQDLKIPTHSTWEFDLKQFFYFSDLNARVEGEYKDQDGKTLELPAPKIYQHYKRFEKVRKNSGLVTLDMEQDDVYLYML